MTALSVVHDTIVVEQTFSAAPERVFQAWADAQQRAQWHFPGDADWELAEFSQDFRVGGHEHARFGPRGRPNFREEGLFLDIVPNRRIVSVGTMHRDDVRISMTLCTVEIASRGTGTGLKLTDQSAFLDRQETPTERQSGWGAVLGKLRIFLQEPAR
jgi:uncharacterized protein YndB with AHSA1/START domain